MGKENYLLTLLLITQFIMCIVNSASYEFMLFSDISDLVCPNEYILFGVETSSLLTCMILCGTDGSCKGLDYNEDTKMCHGCKDLVGVHANCSYGPVTFSHVEGTVMYAKDKGLLVSGIAPISSADITESGHMGTGLDHSCFYSRYCFVEIELGTAAWTTGVLDTNQWIQARFMRLAVVVMIYLLPRPSNYQYVSSYKLIYSSDADCNDFHYYTDSNGADMILAGNTDASTPTTTVLQDPITARCVRIQPMTWMNHISLRFDVIGYYL